MAVDDCPAHGFEKGSARPLVRCIYIYIYIYIYIWVYIYIYIYISALFRVLDGLRFRVFEFGSWVSVLWTLKPKPFRGYRINASASSRAAAVKGIWREVLKVASFRV